MEVYLLIPFIFISWSFSKERKAKGILTIDAGLKYNAALLLK
jgi:hypothetical protein